ncbi:hypothetical protein GWK47_005301 [Chionoecetes opilio]|uniref:Uncharacterized protein n=1 Tax=Chionoecetes opilio TaxID=41210 RepID=A0A8J5CX65_CHIOP|nr:hypothetical protein GWK47_005301 [Chionoecetes opilio]
MNGQRAPSPNLEEGSSLGFREAWCSFAACFALTDVCSYEDLVPTIRGPSFRSAIVSSSSTDDPGRENSFDKGGRSKVASLLRNFPVRFFEGFFSRILELSGAVASLKSSIVRWLSGPLSLPHQITSSGSRGLLGLGTPRHGPWWRESFIRQPERQNHAAP